MNEAILKKKAHVILLRDGKEYVLLPLVVNQVIEILPLITELTQLKDEGVALDKDVFLKMRKLVFDVLVANGYDAITEEKVGNLIDLTDIKEIIAVILGQNPELAADSEK